MELSPRASGEESWEAEEQLLRDAGSPEISRMGLTEKFRSAEGADELKDVVTTALPADLVLHRVTVSAAGDIVTVQY